MTNEAVGLRAVTGEPGEMDDLQSVFESSPTYFERVNGGPPGYAEAASTYTALPPGSTYEDKHVLAITLAGRTVGCIDVIRGYPDGSTAMLGLLLIGEPWQGRGIGSRAYRQLESQLSRWRGVERVRIGVVRTNSSVLGFWHRLGFVETGEAKPYSYGAIASEVVVLEKPLAG